jgi:RNA 2',3'-cyclic 3'-phosphodiesterase
MIRTFLAAELSPALRAQLAKAQEGLRQRLGRDLPKDVRISWVQPASIHLTVKFLGDTDEELITPLRASIQQAITPHVPIHIPLDRLGVFPRPQEPRVLWIGPSETWDHSADARRLLALHQAVEASCQSLGFTPEERPLSPHLTLARIKEGERQLSRTLAQSGVMELSLAVGALTLASLVMMKSELRPTGSLYTELWQV